VLAAPHRRSDGAPASPLRYSAPPSTRVSPRASAPRAGGGARRPRRWRRRPVRSAG